jgi:hypothetical protein
MKKKFFVDFVCIMPSLIFFNYNEYAYGFKLFRWMYLGRITSQIFKLVDYFRKMKLLSESKSKMIASIFIFFMIISIVLHNLACTYLWLGYQCYEKRYHKDDPIICPHNSWTY